MAIDYSTAAFPKTSGVKLNPYRYSQYKRSVWIRQGQGCGICFRPIGLSEMELHHESRQGVKTSHGRGMGGGKRDDLKTVGLCHWCHQKAEEEKR
jgi:hypothetical protein